MGRGDDESPFGLTLGTAIDKVIGELTCLIGAEPLLSGVRVAIGDDGHHAPLNAEFGEHIPLAAKIGHELHASNATKAALGEDTLYNT